MTSILITGGSGFIGSHLINQISQENPETSIFNLDLRKGKNTKATHIVCDINNEERLSELSLPDIDICIHLAALCKEPGYEWDQYFQTNHVGTLNVIKLCSKLGVKKIIFTSTMMVYKAEDISRSEESITAPDTAYGSSKLLAEKELEKWNASQKDRILKIIRPAVVFGENENANFTRLYSTLKMGFFSYIGKSDTVKSNVYVHELNRFILFLLQVQTKQCVFNFSFPEKASMKFIIDQFKEVFGFKVLTIVMPYKFMLIASYFFETLNGLGLKNAIHHRRIQKLYYSTYIYPSNALKVKYKFKFNLKSALMDWKKCLK